LDGSWYLVLGIGCWVCGIRSRVLGVSYWVIEDDERDDEQDDKARATGTAKYKDQSLALIRHWAYP